MAIGRAYRGTTIVVRDHGSVSAIRRLRGLLNSHLQEIKRTINFSGLYESAEKSQKFIEARQRQVGASTGNWWIERRKLTRVVLLNDHLKALLAITGSKKVPPVSAIAAWKAKVRPDEEITDKVLYRTQEFLRQRIQRGGWALEPRLNMPDIVKHIEGVVVPNVIFGLIKNMVDKAKK